MKDSVNINYRQTRHWNCKRGAQLEEGCSQSASLPTSDTQCGSSTLCCPPAFLSILPLSNGEEASSAPCETSALKHPPEIAALRAEGICQQSCLCSISGQFLVQALPAVWGWEIHSAVPVSLFLPMGSSFPSPQDGSGSSWHPPWGKCVLKP